MKRIYTAHCIVLLLSLLLSFSAYTQNFSNKGQEFWTCFPVHVDQTAASIKLYLTSDKPTYVYVEIVGTGLYVNTSGTTSAVPVIHSIVPNIPTRIGPISNSTVYMGNNPGVLTGKAIRVRTITAALPPFVAYSHIYSNAQSDASLILPVTTLGRDYFTLNFPQNPHCVTSCGGGNPGPQRAFIAVMAVEPGTTTVNFTLPPGYPTNGVSPTPASSNFSVTLNQGEVYQLLSGSASNSSNTLDLTGTRVQSISTTPGQCKKIAVYSGSSRVEIKGGSCSAGTTSGDNLYEIMYPTSTWGKNYVIPPVAGRPTGNGTFSFIKIIASKNATSVVVNGGAPTVINAGQSITLNTNTITHITANNAINVAQYYSSALNCQTGGNNRGDPSMVVWSPVEQTLKDITLYSNYQDAITNCYISVVTKTKDTSFFRLDNYKIPFTVVSGNPTYAYSDVAVSCASASSPALGNHRLKSDSGFISVAYGWGNYESYGYSSGANVKNLNQFITASADSDCVGNPVSFKGTAVYTPSSWKWYFGDGNTANTQNVNYAYANPGKYKVSLVTVVPGGLDCDSQDSTTIEIIINAKPVTKFGWLKNCMNDTIQFRDSSTTATSNVNNWRWDFGDGDTSTQQHPKHKYNSAGTFQVKLRSMNNGFCADSLVKTITIDPVPSIDFTTAEKCKKDTFVFNNLSSISSGSNVSWKWRFGNGDSSIVQHPRYYFDSVMTYPVTLIVTSDKNCTDSLQKPVVVNYKPQAIFGVNNVCFKDTSSFLDSSIIGGGSIINWHWRFADGNTSALPSPKHYYGSPASYIVWLRVSSDSGCVDSTSRITTVYQLPKASFPPLKICSKDTVSFTDGSIPGTGSISNWYWDFGDGDTSGSQHPRHFFKSGAGTYNVQLVARSSVFCSDTIKQVVRVHHQPKADFQVGVLCFNDSAFFINKSSLTTGSMTYDWHLGDVPAVTSTLKNPVHNYTKTGSYSVFLKATSDSGCTDTITKLVTVYNKPKADFNAPPCPEDTITFTDLSTIDPTDAITGQFWDFGDGNTSNLKDPKKLFAAENTFNIKLVVYSAFCKDSINKPIKITFKPKADFLAPAICEYDSMSFTDNSVAYISSIDKWDWNFGSGNTSTLQNPKFRFGSPGTFNVQLITGTVSGCSDTFSQNVTVHPKPVSFFSLLNKCYIDSAAFVNQSTVSSGTIDFYTWDFGDGGSSTLKNPKHQYSAPSSYNVVLVTETDKGCRDTSKLAPVQINPSPKADFSMNNACEGDTVFFKDNSTASAPDVITQWKWNFGNGNTDTLNQNPSTVYNAAGNYNVSISLKTSANCEYSNLLNKPVTIYPRPVVQFEPDPDTTTILLPEVNFINKTQFGDNYQWDFGDTSTSTDKSPTHKYQDTGTFVVKVVVSNNPGGCRDSATGIVVIQPSYKIYFPTAFSPNTDGLNELFEPKGEGMRSYELVMYNKWGQIIFEGKPNQGWNGGHRGDLTEPEPEGVYAYMVKVIDIRGRKHYYNGVLTLLR